MVFSSLLFLWLFLPIVIIGYYILGKHWKNLFLLLASLLFYAWGEPLYIFIILGSICINWFLGILIEKTTRGRVIWLSVDILFNLFVLGYFKYYAFLIKIVNQCLQLNIPVKEVKLPIGISFFTFQILSYIIDLYRKKFNAQRNIFNLALYILFFPQLIAGPIVQYKDVMNQIECRELSWEKFMNGGRKFFYGLGKKVIIANTLAYSVDKIFMLSYGDLSGALAWLGIVMYMFQIYYDFSGYSDMAIGLGKIFGFEFQENFNYPYLSVTVSEFWNRWHISLGAWFKEYLYIPLGGNRKGKIRTYLNLMIVFMITGFWHGASFNFLIWGMYYGCFEVIERIGLKRFFDRHRVIGHLYLIIVVGFGWVLFRTNGLVETGIWIKRLVMPWNYGFSTVFLMDVMGYRTCIVIILAVLGIGFHKYGLKSFSWWKTSYVELGYCMLIYILSISLMASDTYNPFIYFRF